MKHMSMSVQSATDAGMSAKDGKLLLPSLQSPTSVVSDAARNDKIPLKCNKLPMRCVSSAESPILRSQLVACLDQGRTISLSSMSNSSADTDSGPTYLAPCVGTQDPHETAAVVARAQSIVVTEGQFDDAEEDKEQIGGTMKLLPHGQQVQSVPLSQTVRDPATASVAAPETQQDKGVKSGKSASPLDVLSSICVASTSGNSRRSSACGPAKKPKPARRQTSRSVSVGSCGVPGAKVATETGSSDVMVQLTENDVLCGRGGMTNHHPGNVYFRKLVRQNQPAYLRASKRDKSKIARAIVDVIRQNLSPSGRFLKKRDGCEGWYDIGDQKAREKTSQALREGAPDIRDEVLGIAVVRNKSPAVSEPLAAPTNTILSLAGGCAVEDQVVQPDLTKKRKREEEEQNEDNSGRCSPRGPRLAHFKNRPPSVDGLQC